MAGKFKAWLEGYLDSIDGMALQPKDIVAIRQRMNRPKREKPAASVGGINREPHDWWRNQFYEGAPPKSDPTAVSAMDAFVADDGVQAVDDLVENLKQQFPRTTFHHPV